MKNAAKYWSEDSAYVDTSLSINRNVRIRDLLLKLDMENWEAKPLSTDASQRHYIRMSSGDKSALVMIAPPPQENAVQFCRVAEQLRACGLRVPNIFALDEAYGLIVVEDFGCKTLSRLLDEGAEPAPLYEMAIDALAALHRHPLAIQAQLPTYSNDQMIEEASLFTKWFVPEVRGGYVVPIAFEPLRRIWLDLLETLPVAKPALILGDYHVDNIMQVGLDYSVANCGLLDFQDASIGPQAFDVMSLLEDARRDINLTLSQNLLSRYRQAMGQEIDPNFDLWFEVMAAHRHMRILGVFVRLARRDAKPNYMKHVSRVARQLDSHRPCVALASIYDWLDANCPDYLAVANKISVKEHLSSFDQAPSFPCVDDAEL